MSQKRTVKHGENIRSLLVQHGNLVNPLPTDPNTGRSNEDHYPGAVTIAAIDPGYTSGIAIYKFLGGQRMETYLEIGQYQSSEIHKMMARIWRLGPKKKPIDIVFEKYVARKTQHGHLGGESRLQFSPIAMMGTIEGFYMATDPKTGRKLRETPEFHPQQASEMSGMPDKRLRLLFPDIFAMTLGQRGAGSKATPHARDAIRHLLVFLRRNHPKLYEALKPVPRRPTKRAN
jgi:hypothetical protein